MSLAAMDKQIRELTKTLQGLVKMTIEGYDRQSTGGRVSFARSSKDQTPYEYELYVWDADTYPDTILCGAIPNQPGAIHVAKPYLCRRTPWSAGQTRNGKRYTYVSNVERDSIVVGSDPEDIERQVITPAYVRGDAIYAKRFIRNRFGGLKDDDGGFLACHLVDSNTDGRAFAKKAG